jgi:hypothetical protein
MTGFARTVLGTLALGLGFGFLACAQSSSGTSGTVRGSVLDPSGAAIKGASVEIQNPVAHYRRSTITDGQGTFEFDNIPYNPYHISAPWRPDSRVSSRMWTCVPRSPSI